MRTGLLAIILGALLCLAAALGVYGWWMLGDVKMSLHGYLALGLGALATLLLGAGLMALVFYSSRHGHDERAHPPLDEPPDRID
ncbi:MAG: hypothetical protein ACE5DS_07615 [Kiloniellaceae bacterium]